MEKVLDKENKKPRFDRKHKKLARLRSSSVRSTTLDQRTAKDCRRSPSNSADMMLLSSLERE